MYVCMYVCMYVFYLPLKMYIYKLVKSRNDKNEYVYHVKYIATSILTTLTVNLRLQG